MGARYTPPSHQPLPLRSLFLLLTYLLLAELPSAQAEEERAEDPGVVPEIELLRVKFERDWLAATLEPLKKHATDLTTLEKAAANHRDYEAAIRLRAERQGIEAQVAQLGQQLQLLQSREQNVKTAILPSRIRLALEEAKLSGGVVRESGMLTQWAKPGAAALWKLPALPPGGYEVLLRYRCGPLEGGSLRVSEARFTLTGSIETTLKGEEEHSLGTLRITNGSGSFTLTAQSVFKDNLMQLLALDLLPAAVR
jgi:hypothetical protein